MIRIRTSSGHFDLPEPLFFSPGVAQLLVNPEIKLALVERGKYIDFEAIVRHWGKYIDFEAIVRHWEGILGGGGVTRPEIDETEATPVLEDVPEDPEVTIEQLNKRVLELEAELEEHRRSVRAIVRTLVPLAAPEEGLVVSDAPKTPEEVTERVAEAFEESKHLQQQSQANWERNLREPWLTYDERWQSGC